MRKSLPLLLLALASLTTQAQEPLARDKYRRFLQSDVPRAYAIGLRGAYAYSFAKPDAMQRALTICKQYARNNCKLYAVDDDVVWKK